MVKISLLLISEEKFNLLPPCMQDIVKKLLEEGKLKHGERFQLGLFLKHLGFHPEQLLKFWTPSKESPIPDITLPIEYYETPKCKTAIECYYCSFKYLKDPISECEKEFSKRFGKPLEWITPHPKYWFKEAKK